MFHTSTMICFITLALTERTMGSSDYVNPLLEPEVWHPPYHETVHCIFGEIAWLKLLRVSIAIDTTNKFNAEELADEEVDFGQTFVDDKIDAVNELDKQLKLKIESLKNRQVRIYGLVNSKSLNDKQGILMDPIKNSKAPFGRIEVVRPYEIRPLYVLKEGDRVSFQKFREDYSVDIRTDAVLVEGGKAKVTSDSYGGLEENKVVTVIAIDGRNVDVADEKLDNMYQVKISDLEPLSEVVNIKGAAREEQAGLFYRYSWRTAKANHWMRHFKPIVRWRVFVPQDNRVYEIRTDNLEDIRHKKDPRPKKHIPLSCPMYSFDGQGFVQNLVGTRNERQRFLARKPAGDTVEIFGLQSDNGKKLNGKTGILIKPLYPKGKPVRWLVRIETENGVENKSIAAKNLRKVE